MLALTVLSAVEQGPAPEDVKAGWVALIIFLLLAVAVAILGRSLFTHLRRAQDSKDAGRYGDDPTATSTPAPGDASTPGGPTSPS
jgi:CDP-diglyceride synthetase